MKLPFILTVEQEEVIDQRLSSFKYLNTQSTEKWFSELCFCILTAQAQAKKALIIQEELGVAGFITSSQQAIANTIRAHGHRFHNKKSEYIVLARTYVDIKEVLTGLTAHEARNFIVQNIKGLGLKEASHFLRNVGYDDVAIIDRHIIRFLVRYNFIPSEPKTLTPSIYYQLEEFLKNFQLPLSRLDLMIWCHMNGSVLK